LFANESGSNRAITVADEATCDATGNIQFYQSYDRVNEVSLRIGDYEALKEAAIDPYLALRDAYLQWRQKKVEAARARSLGGKAEPPPGPP
jgi:ABC-type transporter lipoprotein component MlaA